MNGPWLTDEIIHWYLDAEEPTSVGVEVELECLTVVFPSAVAIADQDVSHTPDSLNWAQPADCLVLPDLMPAQLLLPGYSTYK